MLDDNLLKTIKEVSLPTLLESFGIHPIGTKVSSHHYLMYLASYRGEHNPSLSVFKNANQWLYKDHATGEVGTNLDLLVRFGLFNNWKEAAAYIAKKYLGVNTGHEAIIHLHNPRRSIRQDILNTSYSGLIREVLPITGSPAEQYIIYKRMIPITVAAHYVSFVRYSYPPSQKVLSGIGWPTCRGGWSIRWPVDLGKGKGKGFVGAGGISFFSSKNSVNSDTCAIFEGIFDFLTYVYLHGTSCDAVVLNSVDNADESYKWLSQYQSITGYLDNDQYGRKCWRQFTDRFGDKAKDASAEYTGFKDYNDFLKSSSTNLTRNRML